MLGAVQGARQFDIGMRIHRWPQPEKISSLLNSLSTYLV